MALAGGRQLPCGGGAASIIFPLQPRLPVRAAPAAMPNPRGQGSEWELGVRAVAPLVRPDYWKSGSRSQRIASSLGGWPAGAVPAAGGGVGQAWPSSLCLGRRVAGLLRAVGLCCGLSWVESEVFTG